MASSSKIVAALVAQAKAASSSADDLLCAMQQPTVRPKGVTVATRGAEIDEVIEFAADFDSGVGSFSLMRAHP